MEKKDKQKVPKKTPEEKAAEKAAKKAKAAELKEKRAAEKAAAKAQRGTKKEKPEGGKVKEKTEKSKEKLKAKPKDKVKTAKKAPKEKGKFKLEIGLSIRLQLLIGFVIPILFCIAIGVISYTKASEGLISNYEKASVTSLHTTMGSFDESMKTVSSIILELAQDKNVTSYALGGLRSDTTKQSETKKTIQNNIAVKQTSTEMIKAIHILPVEECVLLTTHYLTGGMWELDSFINEMMESEDGILFEDKWLHWYTAHPFMDEQIDTEGYIMFASRCFTSGKLKGIVIVDISSEAVTNLISQLDFGEGSYVAFITPQGAEISTDPNFTASSVEGIDWEKESDYIQYNGETYFYMTAVSEETGAKMLALVPKSYITKSTDDIRSITVALVLLACVIAVALSVFIIITISSNIKKSVVSLERVSKGDLTTSGKKERVPKNEFGKLHGALGNTVIRMRELIGTVSEMKDAVLVAGDKVMDSGNELGTMTENVSAQIEEIGSIIATQDIAISDCNTQMQELSVQIKSVSDNLVATINEVTDSQKMIDEGMATVEEMVNQSEQTADATKEVQAQVVKLADKLGQITDFVNDIQEIASQTNLLSLNASIEAARAGEQGRGFSVVAEEIRKLADNSGQTAIEINKIIDEITSYSQSALKKVSEAGNISTNQMQSAKKTITAFDQMNGLMEGLVTNMKGISSDVEEMNAGRHSTLKAIRGISESSEHTVQATDEINRFLERQMEAAETLKLENSKMQENMIQLEEAIQTFKL